MTLDDKICVWVDVDGTVANSDHRQHLYQTKNWSHFMQEIVNDPPHKDMVELVRILAEHYWIVICTGRPDDTKADTEAWLKQHNVPYNALYMRVAGDNRSDAIVKIELLHKIQADGFEVAFALEDRNRVVAALRENGIRVLHVQEGDF